MANSVDLDEVAHYETTHQDLNCLQIQLFSLCYTSMFSISHTKGKACWTPCLPPWMLKFFLNRFNSQSKVLPVEELKSRPKTGREAKLKKKEAR